jgi:odorant receptor
MCAHISSQFEIIGSQISTLIEDHEHIERFSREQNKILYQKLKEIVKDHQKAIGMCNKMSQCFSVNVLMHIVSSAFITCIGCLMIMLAEGVDKLIFLSYIAASTCQIFIYCFGGTLLIESSTQIQFSAYNFPWYKCDCKIRKLILMMMIRGQKSTAIDVPFFETSMETFGFVSLITVQQHIKTHNNSFAS